MATKFEQRMALLAKKNGLKLDWQGLQLGYRRARFTCDSHEELMAVLNLVRKMRDVHTEIWSCHEGVFEGYVYAMDVGEFREMSKQQEAERQRVEDWWQRYHIADAETRRLMACGAIQ